MFVHGDNLRQKENHPTKYRDVDSRRYLLEIRANYDKWKADNDLLFAPTSKITENESAIIVNRVKAGADSFSGHGLG